MKIKTENGEVNVASQGQSTLNTVLGAVGTAGSMGILSGILGGNRNQQPQSEGDRPVTRYEMSLWQQINEEKTKNALLEAKGYTDKAMFDVQAQFGQQGAWNAAQQVNINMLRHQLGEVTKYTVPESAISAPVVPPTVSQTTTQTQQG
jgi:hypothetical protein